MKVYLDMDGVIADFHAVYSQHVPEPGYNRARFHDLVLKHRIFERLPQMPNAGRLLQLLFVDLAVPVEILSSLGTHHIDVSNAAARQKTKWLQDQGIEIPANFVKSWAYKHEFATPTSIMIDDRADVIENFRAAGGLGVLYNDKHWDTAERDIRSAVTRAKQRIYLEEKNSVPN